MNSSNISNDDALDILPIQKAMFGFGIIAAIENVGILLVLCSTKRLLKSSSLLIGLTVGHALNGLCHAITTYEAQTPSAFAPISRLSCMLGIPNAFIALYQLLPVILVLIGVERLLAVRVPAWYRAHCTPWRQWVVTATTYAAAVAAMVVNALDAWVGPGLPMLGCSPPEMFGRKYMLYGVHGLAMFGGFSALALTLIGISIGRRRIKKLPTSSNSEISRMKKQIRLTKCMLAVSCIDVVFVSFPNVIFILYNSGLVEVPVMYAVYASLIYCIDSALNIVAYLLFNRDFRAACCNLVRCGSIALVEPISAGQATKQSHRAK